MRTLILFVALTASAADTPKRQISADQRARFWRAQAEAIAAQARIQQVKAALDAVQAEMANTCGDQPLMAAPDGEPTCGPKPETLKAPASGNQ